MKSTGSFNDMWDSYFLCKLVQANLILCCPHKKVYRNPWFCHWNSYEFKLIPLILLSDQSDGSKQAGVPGPPCPTPALSPHQGADRAVPLRPVPVHPRLFAQPVWRVRAWAPALRCSWVQPRRLQEEPHPRVRCPLALRRVVLAGAGHFQLGADGKTAAVLNWLESASSGRLLWAQAKVHHCQKLRGPAAYRPYLLQPNLFTRSSKFWAVWKGPTDCYQWGQRGIRTCLRVLWILARI